MIAFSACTCFAASRLISDLPSERAVLYAAALATLNAVCALGLSRLGAQYPSTKGFFGAIFGGMVLRMGLTLSGLVLGLKALALPALPLAVSLLAFTALFTTAEVALWSRQDFSPRGQLS